MSKEKENCMYCHEWKDLPNFGGAGLPLQMNPAVTDRIEQCFEEINHPLYIKFTERYAKLFLDDGQRWDMYINYCPKCGRRLNND